MNRVINIIKKHAFFGVVFSIAKATVYFVPLLLADVLSSYDFGVLEYALAGLGFVINALINLGVPGAYPYFILRKKDFSIKNGFVFHPLWLLVLLIINQVAYYFFGLKIEFYIAFNVSYIIANQVFYSTQLKSHEKGTKAVIIDSGIYLLLLVLFILYKTNVLNLDLKTISLFIVTYAIFYGIIAIWKYLQSEKTETIKHYKKILKFSFNLMISTFLIFLITTSGRILVEYFFDFELVGVYAFYFRLAAVVVMIHQVVNIALFKKMYTFKPEVLDKYYNLFFVFIFTLSIIAFFITPLIAEHFSVYFNETFKTYKAVYFLLSAQMVMWIASALNSNIIDRENITYKNNPRFIVLLILSAVVFYALKDSLSLSLLTYIHYSIIFMACLIQYYSLSRIKIYFKKSAIILTTFYIITSCGYFYYFN